MHVLESEQSAWMTPGEASMLARCCTRTLNNHDAELKPIRSANGRRMYSRAAVEAWIKRRTEGSAP